MSRLQAGEAFRVRDYEQMEREILRYMDDAGYYGWQSARARERAKELLDSRKSFGEAIEKLEEKIKMVCRAKHIPCF